MQAIAIILLLITCVASLLRPAWALVFCLTFYCMEMPLVATTSAFGADLTLGNYVWGLTMVLAAAVNVFRQPDVLRNLVSPFSGIVLLFFSLIFISMLWTPSLRTAWLIIEGAGPGMAIFLLLAPLFVRDERDINEALTLLMIVGSIIAVSMMANPIFDLRGGRLVYMVGKVAITSPLAIGRLGGMMTIVAALMYTTNQSVVRRGLRLLAFIIGLLFLLLSGSRGQTVFAAIVILILYPVARPIVSIRAFALTVFGVVVAAVVANFGLSWVAAEATIDRWASDRIGLGIMDRFVMIRDLFAAFFGSPTSWIFGLGFSAYGAIAPGATETYTHNILVDALCEQGLVGLTLLIFAFYVGIRLLLKLAYSDAPGSARRALYVSLLGFFIFDILIGQKEGNLFSLETAWLVGIIGASMTRRYSEELEPRLGESADCVEAPD